MDAKTLAILIVLFLGGFASISFVLMFQDDKGGE